MNPSLQRQLAEAGKALSQGQVQQARQTLRQVLAGAPGHPNAQFLYGVASLMAGDGAEALRFLRKAASQSTNDATIQMYLGMALHDTGATVEALACLRRACELAPGQAPTWYNLGKALKQDAMLDDASEALQRAVTLDERHLLAHIALADIATMQGRITQAVSGYRQVLRLQPDHAQAWHGLANLKTEPLSPADTAHLRQALQRPGIHPDTRVALGFSLFRALEDQQDYAAAFEALRQANSDKRKLVDWDAAAEHQRIGHIMEAFRPALPPPRDATLGHEAIFIVSMPRSGSTLVEHILASHSQVEGANEIPDLPAVIEDESRRRNQAFPDWVGAASADDWQRLGQDYLARTARWRTQHPRFTDKGLLNWPLVGAIRAMLPGARIIHCHRDPVENCFACYRQLFGHGMHFSYDLGDLTAHYRDHQQLAGYWQQRFPGQLLDFSYETLLDDTEAQIRRLLDFCGLPLEPACLTPHLAKREVRSTASAAQVRQPIARTTPHGELYGDLLLPLRQRLDL
ncbi:tetratricopeptide repeat-containing sulfotransferase family protein [Dyella sp. A6]|uniref:tetratricopeptide repeat-containing sulfotransferase family protein n=1 Tax=Dyella aluminiiresistens TaxID=3069105 RepID=UPI002E76C828|nr:sulfotransferase [Dyella sp. A6]